ncbi:MAG TPA: S-layer homology domain-containing protein [Candidatus Binatia bacterium]|jgi:tetratricopeptide (TPR) repeat protein
MLVVTMACAEKTTMVALPAVTTPHFPDFVRPVVPADLAALPAASNEDRAWQFLQAGDLRNADREVAVALKLSAGFYPAETTGGYVQLAQKDPKSALARFDRALSRRGNYAPALAGRGDALVALNREGEAIEALQAAFTADPSLTDLTRRIEVLRFRAVERDVNAARQAAQSGKADDALRAYRVAIDHSPETGFLYRERGAVERDHSDADAALADFRKAASLDVSDAASLAEIAQILDARNDFDAALKAYNDALAIEPNERIEAKRNAMTTRAEVARLPAEYRAIESAPQITRGDLAALIGVRLAPLLQVTRARDAGVMTDIRGHWAESWILAVTRAGVLDPFVNHTFQPRTVVRRVDFAQAMTRLLAKVAVVSPAQARTWANARGRFTDISAGHLAYPAASTAVAAGVMTAAPDGSFEPTRVVTGSEAVEAIEHLRAMASVSSGVGASRR